MKNAVICLLLLAPVLLRAQVGSDIYLFDLKIKKGVLQLSNPVNVTDHKGYDNQPYFDRVRHNLFYSSFDENGRADIKGYILYPTSASAGYQRTYQVTATPGREYSPTLTPDKKYISCILQRDNGKQDLVKYPYGGGTPEVLVDNLTVGYHVWIDENMLLLFVLGEKGSNTLQEYDLRTKTGTVLTSNIGRSLHRIPGENAFSFISKADSSSWMIKRYDPRTRKIRDIAQALPQKEDLVWTNKGVILMSDGRRILSCQPAKNKDWNEVKMQSYSFMKGVTRLAIDPKNTRLAVVVVE